jgi:hypothetical protein
MPTQQDNKPDFIKISGQLSNLVITPTQGDFGFQQIDDAVFSVMAAATLAMGSLGALPSQMRSNRPTRSTDAEYVEFDLGNKHCKGLIRKCYYKDGDTVNVVARLKDDEYEIYAIAEPASQTMTLYPHCVRGSNILWKQTIREWLMKSGGFGGAGSVCTLIVYATQTVGHKHNLTLTLTVLLAVFSYAFLVTAGIGLWAWLEYRQEIEYAKLAEICFETLGFPDPKNIDLNIFSNEYLGNTGVNYITFRYPDPVNTKSS